MKFNYSVTTEIRFGRGLAASAGRIASEYGAKKTLLVYDMGIEKAGIVAPIRESFKAAGLETVDFDEVTPNPLDVTVESGKALALKEGIDSIIAIGGGSSIDCAKAINILLNNPGKIDDYAGLNLVKNRGYLLIAVPTTAGTSSDITATCIITSVEKDVRYVVRGRNIAPVVSITDPSLTDGLPAGITATTGMDALTHAIESYVSRFASPITEMQSLKAAELIYPNLRRAVEDKSDTEARDNMMLGCVLAGSAFSNAALGLAHNISNPMSAIYKITHGIACSVTLPAVIEFNYPAASKKYDRLAEAVSPGSGKKLWELIADLQQAIGMPRLSDLKLSPDDLEVLAKETMKEHFPMNPRQDVTEEDILNILKKSY